MIPLNERHLKRLLTEYIRYYHVDRTHLGLEGYAKHKDESRAQAWIADFIPSTDGRFAPPLRLSRVSSAFLVRIPGVSEGKFHIKFAVRRHPHAGKPILYRYVPFDFPLQTRVISLHFKHA